LLPPLQLLEFAAVLVDPLARRHMAEEEMLSSMPTAPLTTAGADKTRRSSFCSFEQELPLPIRFVCQHHYCVVLFTMTLTIYLNSYRDTGVRIQLVTRSQPTRITTQTCLTNSKRLCNKFYSPILSSNQLQHDSSFFWLQREDVHSLPFIYSSLSTHKSLLVGPIKIRR
jgi:hypothetical protein